MPRKTAAARGYGSRWQKARAGFLAAHPWCAWCRPAGKLSRAEHVHHSTPHKGDTALFWDRSRWVPLCQECHNRDAQQVETRGYADRIDAGGFPADPTHPFYRGEGERPTKPRARQRPTSSPCDAIAEATRGTPTLPRPPGGSKVEGRKGGRPVGIKTSQLVSPSGGFRKGD